MKSLRRLATPSLALFIICFTTLSAATDRMQSTHLKKQVFTVGIVPQFDARKIHYIWSPILKHLEKETGYQFRIKGSPTIPEFETEFNAGRFDFVYMNPYHVLLANKSQGYIPLVRDTGNRLHGILVVPKESPITDPKALNGKTISFPAPNALGASLMMRADLHDMYDISIEPRYVKTHSSVYLNVILGLTTAGGGVQNTLNQQSREIRDGLRIIYKTRDVAPHPFSAHPRVPSEVIKQVKQALLEMGSSEQGKAKLALIPIRKIGTATIEDYSPLNNMALERFYVAE